MFNGVRSGIKNFFKGRGGRRLSFASSQPVKVQAGANIVEIAQGAVDKNTDNLIIASLKATIEDLKIQLAANKDAALQSKLEWATEYLALFEDEVAKIRKKKPTSDPTAEKDPKKLEHELKTIFENIKTQSNAILSNLINLSFLLVHIDNFENIKLKIEEIYQQVSLYEQIVKVYTDKGGKEEYPKIVYDKLKGLYKKIVKTIEEFKDELKESSEEKYELKNNIIILEKFADYLVKFAESPEVYAAIRTEIDKELADAAKKKHPEPPKEPTPPPKPSYQDDVDAYEAELNKLNSVIIELNSAIAEVEALITVDQLTPEVIDEYISLEDQIKKYTSQIESSKVTLEAMRKKGKDDYKIDIAKLTRITNITVAKVQYKANYDLYIETLDRKAIEAIKRIKDLELSKTNAKQEDIDKINLEIMILYKFLLAINSLVDKRIVQYSKVNHTSITELYKSRLARRKEIAENNKFTPLEPITDIPEGKTEIDVFKERINELCDKWLKALRTAPISRKGLILLDEKVYADEMSTLIANSYDETKLKIIIEASKQFNEKRAQLIKDKRAVLNRFREKVTTRITLIFQSGTIVENVKKGIDYNEWLTEIEYLELIHLSTEPEYTEMIPNAVDLIKEYIADQEKKYQVIKKSQQSDIIEKLSSEFAKLISKVEAIPLDDKFEETVIAVFDAMKAKYKVLKDFDYEVDFDNNEVIVSYKATQYEFNSGAYKIIPQKFEHVIMSQNKYKKYQASKNIPPVVEPPKKEDNEPTAEIKFGEEDPSNAKVTNRTLKLATNRPQVINRAKSLIIKNADSLTVSLIKQGLRIRYNENLRDQLKALNAKISLVNKSNYRSRKDIKFQGEETVQDLAFKTPKDKFDIEDYKIEIRLIDNEKKRSDLLYTFDLENISNELHGRTK